MNATLLRTFTASPGGESDPNVLAVLPADGSSLLIDAKKRDATGIRGFAEHSDAGTLDYDVRLWLYEWKTGKWMQLTAFTNLGARQMFQDTTSLFGPGDHIYPQIPTVTSGTIDAPNPMTVYLDVA